MDGRQADEPVPEDAMDVSESLALVDAERRYVHRRVHADPALLFTVWGVAWLVGFGAAYLAHGSGRMIPGWLGVAVPGVLIVAALIGSVGYSIAVGRGVSGPSRTVKAMYGWSWTLGFGCLAVVNTALIRRGLTSDDAAMLWSASALLLVGVLYLAGGMVWQDRVQYGMGTWIMLCAAGAVFAGVPGNFLVQALAGGGGFLALAGYHRFLGPASRRHLA